MIQQVKNPPAKQVTQETWVRSQDEEDPVQEGMAATPVFLVGKSHGQRSLTGYGPWGHKELDTTEHIVIISLNNKNFLKA